MGQTLFKPAAVNFYCFGKKAGIKAAAFFYISPDPVSVTSIDIMPAFAYICCRFGTGPFGGVDIDRITNGVVAA